ncbi:MAG: amidase [Odoribacter sp.]|nr:amidase [Odoribacter sp.]
MQTPEINVGIFSGPEITFTLNGKYYDDTFAHIIDGGCTARFANDKLILQNGIRVLELTHGVILRPVQESSCSFTLHSVTIGVDFHWQRKEDQEFKGSLKLIIEDKKVTAVNVLTIEDYLVSVISSEMRATSSVELLKAHAVISRSWLLAQINKRSSLGKVKEKYETYFRTETEIIRWYDREDHVNFDVCADDHCQRYQGITRASTPVVVRVINDTYGEVLTSGGLICDARYSKCCGGISELFENVWEPVKHPYIQKVVDNQVLPQGFDLNLADEIAAGKWILGKPEAFCNSSDKEVLSQVLNDYDQETNDFFRWKVEYTQKEVSDLVKYKTGIDFGSVIDILPVERGSSGRLIKMKIVGSKKEMVIGKELEIRKTLSKTHLYSSCFVVEKNVEGSRIKFILHGAGWGHGVGLCQIGAAVMGSKGYTYREILGHYFKDVEVEKKY